MHLSGSPDLRGVDLARARPRAYSDSKLYVTALAMAYARLWPDTMAHAVDPGCVPTRMGGPGPLLHRLEAHTGIAPAVA